MHKKWILILLLAFAPLLSTGQKTEPYHNPSALFLSAVDLYDKELYVASVEKFTLYVKQNPNASNTNDAQFFIANAKLKLDHQDAFTLAVELVNKYPENHKTNETHLAIANLYLSKHKFRSAARYYKKVELNSLPEKDKNEFTFNRAYSLFKSKKYEDAAKEFKTLTLKENPFYIKSNYYYGYALYQERKYNEALKAFNKIKGKGPQTMNLYIAQIHYLKGDYKKAIAVANAIALPRIKKKGHIVVGKSYYKLKDYKNAALAFERGEISPDSITEMEQYEVGYTYYKTKKYLKAFDYLSPIASNGNDLAQLASYNLGHCFLALNKKQNALNAFFEAQRKNYSPKVREEALFQYAKLSYDMNNSVNATSAFQAFIKDFPNSEHGNEAKSILASLFVNTNDYKTALNIIEDIDYWDNNTKLLYQKISLSRGLELINGRDYKNAKIALNNSIKDPLNKSKYATSIFWLAEVANRTNNDKEAREKYLRFLSLDEAKKLDMYPSAFYSLGYIFFEQNDYKRAASYFNEVIALKTKYKINNQKLNDNYLRVGDCNYMLRNYTEALDAYSYTSSGSRAESDYALFQQGMIYGLSGKASAKIQIMKRIPRDFPNSIYIPDAIFELASEQLQEGDNKSAERNFQYLISDFPKSSYKKRCYLSLGLIYYNTSKDDEALTEFKNVVMEFPGTEEAKNAAGFIKKIYISNGESKKYFSWLETLPNHSITASYKDSVSYTAATKRLRKGDYTVSLNDFETYIKDFPHGYFLLDAHNYALLCARKIPNEAKVIEHLKVLAEGNTTEYTEPSIWELATIYEGKGDCKKTIEYLEKGAKITRSLDKVKESLYKQMNCYETLKDTANYELVAKKLFGHKVLTQEQEGKVLSILGEKEYRDSNYSTALTLFSTARNKFTDENGAKSLYYIAQIHYNNDSLDFSKKKILEFGEEFSYYEYWFGKCFLLLGDIYIKKEDIFQAKATLNSIIDNFDDKRIIAEATETLALIEAKEKLEKEENTNKDEDTIEDKGE